MTAATTLSQSQFDYVRTLVHRESAIVLEPGKEYLVEARLLPLARAAGLSTVAEFVAQLQRRPDRGAQQQIVEALTTNETSWFRDGDPFRLFTSEVIPGLLESRRAERSVRVWSAACSSGQEPYSVAMLLDEHLPAGWRWQVHGTDLSGAMLTRARSGRYTQMEVNRGLPAPMLVKHFHRAGTQWEISEALRRRVSFAPLNLAAPFPPLQSFDVVFLRNVLIYFDVETKRSILRRVRSVLRPDGYLFLGGAESTIGVDDGWQRHTHGRNSVHRPRSNVSGCVGALSTHASGVGSKG